MVNTCNSHVFSIQVITRLICSSCPVVYWYAATVSASEDDLTPSDRNKYDVFNNENSQASQSSVDILDWENKGYNSRLIYVYFMLYLFVGTAAFSNFLPWT